MKTAPVDSSWTAIFKPTKRPSDAASDQPNKSRRGGGGKGKGNGKGGGGKGKGGGKGGGKATKPPFGRQR